MLLGLRKTAEPLRVVAIFAGFKYGHVTVRYSPQRDLWAMPRHRMAPPGGLSVLPGPVLAGGESSEWATRITLIPRFQTPHEPSQPQSQNRTLRNGSASDRKGPTPRKDEHTGNKGATRRPLAAHRPAAQSTRRLDRRLRLASGLLLRGLIAASGRGRAGQWLQRRREV